MRLFLIALFVCLLASAAEARQAKTPPPAPAAPAQEAGPTPPPNYTYEPDNRRDPFVSLVNRGSDARPTTGARPDGLAGILVDEVVVRGILQTKDGWIAMIGLPSGRTHTVRPGDRVMDGTVRTITARAVVFMQEVDNPLSLEKQREVRKFLRGEVK